ncbi:hypothetical protein BofuT4_uP023540.1 [Botrytis cinerea T4]|uniref:Uncharacterized protein n=1 Tax=Botryotinia fuckeliana (strain T4) TaxID=999810 RepID=G2YH52_BOTF4|nr:hypothetical protein BofuT4_uP023540.1 [Botrytis cinerea T4]
MPRECSNSTVTKISSDGKRSSLWGKLCLHLQAKPPYFSDLLGTAPMFLIKISSSHFE